MKCSTCKVDKSETDFNWRNKALGKRKTCCIPCDRIIRKRCYYKNKEKQIAAVTARTAKIKQEFQDWKSTLSCSLCAESDVACLDFHHIDESTKDFSISQLTQQGFSQEKLIAEIQKCVVVCSNCHRKIHKYGWSVVAKDTQPTSPNIAGMV